MMDQSPLEIALLRRSKWLIHALIISVTLNIALIATFSYFVMSEKKMTVSIREGTRDPKKHLKSVPRNNAEVLKTYLSYSFQELLRELGNEGYVEEGQRCCDLAVACLVAFHHFDLERALSGFPVEKRDYAFQCGEYWTALTLFSGLNEDRLRALRQFAAVEMWPLTPEGLFRVMKEKQGTIPADLTQAFCLTSEFYTIERAFGRLPYLISREVLLQLLLDGEWVMVSNLAEEVQNHPEGKIEDLGGFLTLFLEKKSKLAAHLLVGMEQEFVLKRLTDDQLEILMGLLEEKTPEVEAFLKTLVVSLRANHFREKGKELLFELTGETLSSLVVKEATPQTTYVVEYGDTLWKISRDLGVPVAKIKELNQLESDVLTPGKELLIPEKKKR